MMINRSPETKASLDDWLTSITSDWPIAAATQSPFENSLHQLLARYPSVAGTEVEAVLWLRLGLIERAHEIVQDGKRGTAAYLHGIVHRLEGDYWNSKYWFRQVQDEALMQEIGAQIIHALEESKAMQLAIDKKLVKSKLDKLNQFQFDTLVDLCETFTKELLQDDAFALMIHQIVKAEWLAVLRLCV